MRHEALRYMPGSVGLGAGGLDGEPDQVVAALLTGGLLIDVVRDR
jgi:hypothetical protein